MKFVKILVIAGFSAACITAIPEPDTESPPPTKDVKEAPPLPGKVRMLCEHGCPATMAYISIMPVLVTPDGLEDVVDSDSVMDVSTDADAGISSPDTCGDIYEFGVCCGDGECQPNESPFFCPQDCL